MKKRLDIFRWFVLACVVITGAFNYRGMVQSIMFMFTLPFEDMSHGWVVPFVSLYVLWTQRKVVCAAAGTPSLRGLSWTLLFLLVAWVGGRGAQVRIEQISLFGLIWAVPYALWGRKVARLMVFPASFLAFTIPISSYLDFFTIHLRILTSTCAMNVLNGLGISVVQSGTALFSQVPGAEFNIDVADPCSGIRSLFAMMALTAAYAYFTQKTALKKWALFACAIPIAMVGNMVRIMSICLVATWFGQRVATGYYHDYSGYVVFLVGVLLMIQAGDVVQKFRTQANTDKTHSNEGGAKVNQGDGVGSLEISWHPFATVLLVGIFAVSVFLLRLVLPAPIYSSADFVATQLPLDAGSFRGDVNWYCHNEQCLAVFEESRLPSSAKKGDGFICPACGEMLKKISLGEQTVLPRDTTILKRTYHANDGRTYAVSIVVAGTTRASIHRPEMCLPAQGFTMTEAKRIAVHVKGAFPQTVRQITAYRSGNDGISLIYWMFCRERETSSHTVRIMSDIWDRSIHNRINRWAMVAINVSPKLNPSDSLDQLELFLSELCSNIRLSN